LRDFSGTQVNPFKDAFSVFGNKQLKSPLTLPLSPANGGEGGGEGEE